MEARCQCGEFDLLTILIFIYILINIIIIYVYTYIYIHSIIFLDGIGSETVNLTTPTFFH